MPNIYEDEKIETQDHCRNNQIIFNDFSLGAQ